MVVVLLRRPLIFLPYLPEVRTLSVLVFLGVFLASPPVPLQTSSQASILCARGSGERALWFEVWLFGHFHWCARRSPFFTRWLFFFFRVFPPCGVHLPVVPALTNPSLVPPLSFSFPCAILRPCPILLWVLFFGVSPYVEVGFPYLKTAAVP